MRTPGFCEGGLLTTVVVGVALTADSSVLVVSVVGGILAVRQDVGVVGVVGVVATWTGGRGGLELLFICCFSGDGVFGFEFTTWSFMWLTGLALLARGELISSVDELDEVEARRSFCFSDTTEAFWSFARR